MQTRVFDALGMTSSTFDFALAQKREHALPHGQKLTLDYTPMPLAIEEALVPVRPAGGAWSNLRDMERYLALELAKGQLATGQPWISQENLLLRRKPQVKVNDKMAYGLGLFVEDDHGLAVMGHGGNTLGFSSDMFFLPEAGVGVVLLTNVQGDNLFRAAVRRKLLELLFEVSPRAQKMLDFAVDTQKKVTDTELSRIPAQPDAAWLKSLEGVWHNPALGKLTLRVNGTTALLDAGEWKSAVTEKRELDGARKLMLLDPPLAGVEFIPKTDDAKRTTLVLEAPQQTYFFEARSAAAPSLK